MSQTPSELKYAASHEWVLLEEDGTVTVGISDHAQDALGDVVFVELPELGDSLAAADEAGVVESVKAASEIYAPVAGEVTDANQVLADAPDTINTDPLGEGWIFKIKPTNPSDIDELMDEAAYKEYIAGLD